MPDFHDGLAKAVPLSPDGRVLVVLKPEAVELRFVRDGRLVREPLACPPRPSAAAFHGDGSRLAVVCEDGGVSVFSVATGEVVARLPAEAAHGTDHPPVGWRSVVWSPQGDRLALTDRVFSARLMPADVSSFSRPLAHQFMALGSEWNGEGTRLMTWSFDNTVRLWDAATGEADLLPVRHRGPVLDAAFSPGGPWCATACRDGTARLWRADSGFLPGPVLRHTGEVRDVAWSEDGRRLVTSSADRTAQLWRVEGTGVATTECRHRGSVERLAVSPDGRHVATVCLDPDFHVLVWRFPGGEASVRLVHPSLAASAAWRDAARLVTVTGDGVLRTWGVENAKLLDLKPAFPVLPGSLRSLQLSPDASHLLAVFEEVPALLVATDGGADPVELEGGPAGAAYWSPCGRFLATTHAPDGAPVVLVRDGTTGATLETLPAPELPLALGPGGRHLAFVDEAYRVFVLDRTTGRRSPPMPHEAVIQAAQFTAGGRLLATGTRDGTLRFWDATTGEAASPPLPHASWIMAIGADAEGRRFFTGVNGGVLSEWVVPPCHASPEEMAALAHGEASDARPDH
jgi:WD40 repeat protein